MNSKTRKMTVAGQFYPDNPETLKSFIEDSLSGRKVKKNTQVKAVILPHAGYVFSGSTAVKTLSEATGSEYDNIFILAPSHYVSIDGPALSSFGKYDTPLGDVSVNTDIVRDLQAAGFSVSDNAHLQEHSLEVQLPLVKYIFPNSKIVPIVCGFMNHSKAEETAEKLKKYWTDDNNLWIISSDFTHYGRNFGYLPFRNNIRENLKELDGGAIDEIIKLSPEGFDRYLNKTGATICGKNPILVMLCLADISKNRLDLKPELVEYTSSGEISGDFSHCVCYAGIKIYLK
ncbi:MAG: AmmeMemoRadiSam system protein B [Victivallales bacterium]|nr:AmmeMemoRadiSam system protein B [Victivallales bacterium]